MPHVEVIDGLAWMGTRNATPGECAARIKDLEDILDLRDAATEALCFAAHGVATPGVTIYDLITDVAAMRGQR